MADFYDVAPGESDIGGGPVVLFNEPLLVTGDTLALRFKLMEINGIAPSTQERIHAIYQQLSETTGIVVKDETMKQALDVPFLSYIPIAWSVYQLVVVTVNAIDPSKPIDENEFAINLNHSFSYYPSDAAKQIEGGADGVTTKAMFDNAPRYVTCPAFQCPIWLSPRICG